MQQAVLYPKPVKKIPDIKMVQQYKVLSLFIYDKLRLSLASNSMNITFCATILTQFILQGGARSQAELPLKCNFSSTFSTLFIVV